MSRPSLYRLVRKLSGTFCNVRLLHLVLLCQVSQFFFLFCQVRQCQVRHHFQRPAGIAEPDAIHERGRPTIELCTSSRYKQETHLSLTNRATHLCNLYNRVVVPPAMCLNMCYPAEFVCSTSNDMNIYITEIRRKNLILASRPSRSLKVIGTDRDRSATCGLLLTFHSNHMSIWYCFQDIVRYSPKISNFSHPTPHKTRMMRLSAREKKFDL